MEKTESYPLHRRDYKRFTVSGSAILVMIEGDRLPLILKDLSIRGISVAGDYPFQINEIVTVIVSVPLFLDAPALKQARTVWCKKTGNTSWEAGLDFGMGSLLTISGLA